MPLNLGQKLLSVEMYSRVKVRIESQTMGHTVVEVAMPKLTGELLSVCLIDHTPTTPHGRDSSGLKP